MGKFLKIALSMCFIAFIIILLILFKNSKKTIKTSTVEDNNLFSDVNNQKIEWGVKRADNHEQPDLGSKNEQIMNKYEGLYLGNKEKPYVYLTFDSGFEAGYTPKILEVLKQNNVKATFFLTEHYINSASDLVKQMIDEGHIIGNHTAKHKSFTSITEREIKNEVMSLHTLVYEKFGYEMKYVRPPKGEYSEKSTAITNSLGYKTVMWSMAYDDWDEQKQGREEYGKQKILENIHNRCSNSFTWNFKG